MCESKPVVPSPVDGAPPPHPSYTKPGGLLKARIHHCWGLILRPRRYFIAGTEFEAPELDPGLYVVATPIGNLRDMTLRGLETLAAADVIYCEDTRTSARLTEHFGITTPRKALHEHNERALAEAIVEDIGRGGRVALISDAGTPLLSDPGFPVVRAVRDAGLNVTWLSDPMHGNTFTSDSGYKTRRFDTILDEVTGFFEVHEALGTVPGGLLVELTGDDVTEVLGGTEKIDDASLALRYETKVDPRLNHQQSLEMAFLVSELLAKRTPRVETI